MNKLSYLIAFALFTTACVSSEGDPTTVGEDPTTSSLLTTTSPTEPECVHLTGGAGPVNTGSVAGNALFLSGESFLCANDVVVVSDTDLNTVAAAAQLAAALGGPLLFPDPRLAAELGRLDPARIHVLGTATFQAPPSAELILHSVSEAVDAARSALDVDDEIRLPAVPDASTIVETIGAIVDRDRVVLPQTNPSGTPPTPDVDAEDVISGLAVTSASESVWLVDASDSLQLLMAAATGRTIGSVVVGYDPTDVLAHPEVGTALAGRPVSSIRFVGAAPDTSDWELAVLANGRQVPGGGYFILPEDEPRRYVAYYGHPETTALGALGEQGPSATLDKLAPYLAAYEGDGRKTIPTFEMLASVASAPITDGDYSYEWPIDTFDQWIEVATENDVYVILDLQPGRDDFLNQAKQYRDLLLLPNVGLALDPEWRLGPDEVHLRQVGHVDAAEVNLVVDWLADLVRDNGLPQKMLIVHQFRLDMILNREILKQRPELQMIVQMDGDGFEAQKDNTYAALTRNTEDAHWSWGWKNFFDEDEPGPPSPESTMGKNPSPVYVSYQ